nr:methyl-accepting chemotaxis protein [Bradyrhizobium sp. UNPF46]
MATSEFLPAGQDILTGRKSTIKDEIVARIPPCLQALRERRDSVWTGLGGAAGIMHGSVHMASAPGDRGRDQSPGAQRHHRGCARRRGRPRLCGGGLRGQDIAHHIAAIQNSTGSAVASVKELTAAMRRIDEIPAAIASAVEQQGAATRDISQNVQMASSGTQTLATSIGTVSGAITETSRSADDVMGAANEVSGASERLAAEVQAFFVKLRSGPMDRRKSRDSDYRGPGRRNRRNAA